MDERREMASRPVPTVDDLQRMAEDARVHCGNGPWCVIHLECATRARPTAPRQIGGTVMTRRRTIAPSELTGWVDERWAWPRGSAAIARWRSAVRLGLARETVGMCEGCPSHRKGTQVPVFEWLGDDEAHRR